jgi:tyrosyl-tRNA synthetase
MFGKIMSVSDELMLRYSILLLGEEIPADAHPLEAKKGLAAKIVTRYHSAEAAEQALSNWNNRGNLEEVELPGFTPPSDRSDLLGIVQAAFASIEEPKSGGDVRRLIQQGSIQIDGEKQTDPKSEPALSAGQVLKLNKKRSVRLV